MSTELKKAAEAMTGLSDALKNMNIGETISLAFGKCPKCRKRLVGGDWLKWCPKRGCTWYGIK